MNILKPPCDEGIIGAGRAVAPCSKKQGRLVLAATVLGSSMVFIDGTAVNVALPALQSHLNATVIDVQWIVESFALFLSALLLLGGSLGDHFGRKRIYAIGVTIFALASGWCGLAPNVTHLIAGRAVQGIGGALLVPGSLALISASFPEAVRGKAIGTWSGSTAITTALGPVIGGWFIEHISWRAIFFLNLPLAIVVLLLIFCCVPESRDETEAGNLDFPGAATATLGLGAIVWGLIESSQLGFRSPEVIVVLVGGAILFATFIKIEAGKRKPMMPLSLFRSPNFTGANLLTLLLYAALAGTLYFFPLNLIQVQRYTATAAGAASLPLILIMFLLSRWSGGLVKRYGPRLPLVIGPTIASLGFVLFMLPGIGGVYWKTFFPAVVVLGFGMAVSVAPLTTTVMNSVEEQRAGIASGINNAVSRTAGLLAIAVMGLIMVHSFNGCLEERLDRIAISTETRKALDSERIKLAAMSIPAELNDETHIAVKQAIDQSFVFGFRRVMFVASALAFLSALAGWLLIRDW